MFIRRSFFYALFWMAVALPLWVLIGWGIYGHGGWTFIGLLISAPVVFVFLVIIAALTASRPTVRRERAVSWQDVGILGAFWASTIGFGFFGDTTTLFSLLSVALGIIAFWSAIVQLIGDGAKRMRETMETFEAQAQRPTMFPGTPPTASGGPAASGDDGVIIIHEVRDEDRGRP